MRLVVVSNRVAKPKAQTTGREGGLAMALRDALTKTKGLWFGWSGDIAEGEAGPVKMQKTAGVTFATVDLSERDYDEYYNGYANRTLWPLFHYRLDLADFTRHNEHGYARVNGNFRDKLLPLVEPDDVVWIHDYHLIPLGWELRQAGLENAIGFFLHIPWPAPEVFLALPHHREVARNLMAYDLIGFQTETDVRAFTDYIRREALGEVRPDGTVLAFGRRSRVGAFPIGIDVEAFEAHSAAAPTVKQAERMRHSLLGRQLIMGVDRLDYSKGLKARFDAYETLLTAYPAERRSVVFLQVSPPSRSDVPEYQEIRQQLEGIAGRINGEFAEPDWTPIRYLNKGFSQRVLASFYRQARVCLVTPLRDGMNLVAKEFIASQDPADPGVLILSRFAGAAKEMADGAILVNPYDTEAVAEAMETALQMSLEERIERWGAMMNILRANDVNAWRDRFLTNLRQAAGHEDTTEAPGAPEAAE